MTAKRVGSGGLDCLKSFKTVKKKRRKQPRAAACPMEPRGRAGRPGGSPWPLILGQELGPEQRELDDHSLFAPETVAGASGTPRRGSEQAWTATKARVPGRP